jgi:hypothetical protein
MPVLFVWGGSEKLPPHQSPRGAEGFGRIPPVERPGELLLDRVRFAEATRL